MVLLVLLLVPLLASAQQGTEPRIEVVDISGPLDVAAVDFVVESIADAAEMGSEAVVIQLSSPGIVADATSFENLLALVADPPLPLVVWVGPAPAVAYGGALELLAAAPLSMAAPGVEIGLANPTLVAGDDDDSTSVPGVLSDTVLTVEAPVPGVVDRVSPAIRQLLQDLDGATFEVGGEGRQVSTLATVQVEGEEEVGLVEVVFHQPGYWDRFLRLAVTPEAAFLFLLAGLTVAAFEFYAIGPGIAAAVAALSLFLASYGVATLPLRWWAVALTLAGWGLLTASYQKGSIAALTGAGGILALLGGLWYVDGAPQLQMNPLVAAVIVAVVVLFYTVAMPTVARSRFSTRTIGRDHLIGSRGVALVDFDPDGQVEVGGARWMASAHRESGIRRGDSVRISEVDGSRLEVERAPSNS